VDETEKQRAGRLAVTRRLASLSINVGRVLRAARQADAEAVEIRRDGTILILMKTPTGAPVDEFETWEREHEQAKAARHRQRD
jgi:hypothetical protein